MISRFCIDRPVLTWVLTIALMLAGLIAIRMLPVSQYPNIAPPVVRIAAMYPGAAAQVVEQSVTQVLEQELKGLKNLLYFDASSSASGEAEIMLTFSQETDNEQALIQVQNKVNQISNPAAPRSSAKWSECELDAKQLSDDCRVLRSEWAAHRYRYFRLDE